MGLLHAFFSISFRSDQIVGGTAINFLALGITSYLFFKLYGAQGTPDATSRRFPTSAHSWRYPRPRHFLDDVFGQLNLMIWLAILLVFVTWVVVFKTPIGLRIRSCGEHPRAADTVGINVYAVRYGAVIGVRHARRRRRCVPLARLRELVQRQHDRRARLHRPRGADLRQLAPVRRRGRLPPVRLLERARRNFLQAYSTSISTLFAALPYVLTLVAVAGVIGRTIPPAADGIPYKKQ